MKVLWIKSDFPLPADTGGKIRTRNLIGELAKRAQVTFLSYAEPGLDRGYVYEMKDWGITVHTVTRKEEVKQGPKFVLRVASKMGSRLPYIVSKYRSSEMADQIRKLAQPAQCDVVLCDFLEMAWCREYVEKTPTVLFEHNVETMIWRRYFQNETNPLKRMYFAYEKERLARYERNVCKKFDLVLTVSDRDGDLLVNEFDVKEPVTIPTGVDTSYFKPDSGEIDNRLVFCGSMDWMPNIDGFNWFYHSIYPLVRKEVESASLVVVGRRPADDILDLAKVDSSLTVTGTVADVRPHIGSGQLYIVPLRIGGGTRIKIYEAMAMKKCVLSTSIGAEGLPLRNGETISIADEPEEFAAKIKELLQDDNKRHKIAEAGYDLVTENFSWRTSADVLYSSLQSVINK